MQSDPFVLNFLFKTQVLGFHECGGDILPAIVFSSKAATERLASI